MPTGTRIDWRKVVDLGKVSDVEIADRLGVHKRTIAAARVRLGIGKAPRGIDWSAVPELGKLPDVLVAHRLSKVLRRHVTRVCVSAARIRRGMPAPVTRRTTIELPLPLAHAIPRLHPGVPYQLAVVLVLEQAVPVRAKRR